MKRESVRQILKRRTQRWERPVPLGQYGRRAWRGRLGDAYPGGGRPITITYEPDDKERAR
jgi:hypothetical protein